MAALIYFCVVILANLYAFSVSGCFLINIYSYNDWHLVSSKVVAEDPVVQLPAGKIRGHVLESENGKPYYAFQEIPYAAAPVGSNRFQVREQIELTYLKSMILIVNSFLGVQ